MSSLKYDNKKNHNASFQHCTQQQITSPPQNALQHVNCHRYPAWRERATTAFFAFGVPCAVPFAHVRTRWTAFLLAVCLRDQGQEKHVTMPL
ncbi:uncharacterized protein LOC142772205 isoform X3 [Rhipicephalus microplus]|uniref:uncharacterized protein LOC142772205 isoform X3 n=1 Tax=Rhipicephalus microplus TaxID=6941 RepID=UPI003F6D3A63